MCGASGDWKSPDAPPVVKKLLCPTHSSLTTRRYTSMIKYWQSTQDYKYFLSNSKVHFDSSERRRLHSELWKPWQKLRLFDTDIAMAFLLPFFLPLEDLPGTSPRSCGLFSFFFSSSRKVWPNLPLPFGAKDLRATVSLLL